jgi:hypothetical protein
VDIAKVVQVGTCDLRITADESDIAFVLLSRGRDGYDPITGPIARLSRTNNMMIARAKMIKYLIPKLALLNP